MTVKLSSRITFLLALITLTLLAITVVRGELDDPGYYFLAAMLSNFLMMTMLLVYTYLKKRAQRDEEQKAG